MKQVLIEIPDNDSETAETHRYPNAYAAIPPNGKTCAITGLKHAVLYRLLTGAGEARHYVRVVSLRLPGASKGKTVFHTGDMLRYLDRLSAKQGSGKKRTDPSP